MTKYFATFFISFLLILSKSGSAQHARWASHGYRKVETIIVDQKDSRNSGRQIEVLNRKGKVTESWEYDYKDSLTRHTVNSISRNFIQTHVYDGRGSIISIETSKFDNKGREIERYLYDLKPEIKRITAVTYDKWGNKIREMIYKNEKLEKERIFLYNNEGLLEKQISKTAEGKIIYEKTIRFLR